MADWVTVAAYLLAALSCLRAAGVAGLGPEARDRAFWQFTTLLLVFLAINELLDLQALLTSLARSYAKALGWYGEHRTVQYAFVIVLAGSAVVFGTALYWLTRRSHVAVRLALAGLVVIGSFVLLRAASFNHLDDLLGGGWQAFTWGSVQEMAGILVVAAAAALYARGANYAASNRPESDGV